MVELEGAVGEVANVAGEEQAEQAQIAQAQAQQAAEGPIYTETEGSSVRLARPPTTRPGPPLTRENHAAANTSMSSC